MDDRAFVGYRPGGLIWNQGRGKTAFFVAGIRDLEGNPWLIGYDRQMGTHFMVHPSHWIPTGPKILRKEGEIFVTDGPGTRSTKVLPPLQTSKW